MGHGILYCTSCQNQLRDPDFEKGAAYKLEGQAYCEECARKLIATLPEDRVNEILHTFESSHDDPPERPAGPPTESRSNRTTRIMKALAATPGTRILTSTSRRMATVPPADDKNATAMVVGIGVAVVILVVLAIVGMSGGSSTARTAPPRQTPPPPVVIPAPSPAGEDRPSRMIAAAREFARRNPDDLQKQISLFEEVLLEPGGARFTEELQSVIRELRRKTAERRAEALAPVEREMRTAVAREDFKAAAASIAAARFRRAEPEWDRALGVLSEEIDREIARAFAPLRDKAVEARRRGLIDEPRRIQDRVAGWGRPELARELETAVAAAAPPPPPAPPTPPPPPPPAPTPAEMETARREGAANDLFLTAENLHRVSATRSESLAKYAALLAEFGTTQLVAGKKAHIHERLEAAKDHVFLAADLRPTGAFKFSAWKKAGLAWTSEADVPSAARPQNFVEVSFTALAGADYAAWAYAGACCAEAFVFHVQGNDLAFLDPRTREKSVAEIGSGLYLTMKPATSLLKSHANHGPRRDPVQWQWVSIALPKYATGGEKRLRFFGETQGFSVSWVVVSATRKTPPADADMRELEKQRPDAPVDSADGRLRQGLVAHWRMDEGSGSTIADAAGHGHAAALKNGVAWTAGVLGKALKFDGDDDQVDCGAAEALNLRRTITVTAWVKCASDPLQYDGVVMKSNKDWFGGYGFYFENKSQLRFFVGTWGDTAWSDISSLNWNHVAGTYDGKRIRVYVNGKEGTGKDRVGEITPSSEALLIGRGSQVAANLHTLHGEIDDVRIYDRALDESEIRALVAVRR